MQEVKAKKPLLILLMILSMTLFNNLFGQTKPNHKQEWDFYFDNIKNNQASLFIDLGLKNVAPLKDKPYAVMISIKMNNSREDGLSSSEESNSLWEIEKKIVEKSNSALNAIYAGRVTSNGYRDLYFYVSDTMGYDKVFSEMITNYPGYHFNYVSKFDKQWAIYFRILYPTPEKFQSIQNRRVVDQLEKNGDKLTKAREVDHWIFFKIEKDRNTFLSKIKSDGFTVVDKEYDKKLGEFPYKLHIKRVDKIDWNSVDKYVLYLWKTANECNGDYDGWETQVEID